MIGHLAVIDMQRVFAEPDSPWAAPRFAEIVPTVGALVDALSPQVTFTRFVAPAEPKGAWLDYYDRWPFARQPPEAPAWELVEPFGRRRTRSTRPRSPSGDRHSPDGSEPAR